MQHSYQLSKNEFCSSRFRLFVAYKKSLCTRTIVHKGFFYGQLGEALGNCFFTGFYAKEPNIH